MRNPSVLRRGITFVVVTIFGCLLLFFLKKKFVGPYADHDATGSVTGHNLWYRKNLKSVNVYILEYEDHVKFFGSKYSRAVHLNLSEVCGLDNFACNFQHEDPEISDVLFTSVWCKDRLGVQNTIEKYHKGRLLSVLNSEAEPRLSPEQLQLLERADIRVDYHPSSEGFVSEVCLLTPSKYPIKGSERKGIVLFLSDCNFKWRTDFVEELMKHVHIDSYGRCLNNAQSPSNDYEKSSHERNAESMKIASQYRMFLQIENTITKDYITEKLYVPYQSGAIPVYWGTPEVYHWVPGNHTFIDITRFKGPLDLALYLKRVDKDDNLFNYHTSNFNWERTREAMKHVCGSYQDPELNYFCEVCKATYRRKNKML